jgi:hypothetical protein
MPQPAWCHCQLCHSIPVVARSTRPIPRVTELTQGGSWRERGTEQRQELRQATAALQRTAVELRPSDGPGHAAGDGVRRASTCFLAGGGADAARGPRRGDRRTPGGGGSCQPDWHRAVIGGRVGARPYGPAGLPHGSDNQSGRRYSFRFHGASLIPWLRSGLLGMAGALPPARVCARQPVRTCASLGH